MIYSQVKELNKQMRNSQNRSIYSLNSQKSGYVFQSSLNQKIYCHLNSSNHNHTINQITPLQQPNLLQPLFYELLQQHSTQYPYLSKIIYLQLLLRQNILLLSNRRQQIKQIWKSMCKKLLQQKPNIFVIDQTTNIDEILEIKSEYNLALVFDIDKLNNYGLNKLLNHDSQLSILAVVNYQFNSEKNKTSIVDQLKGVFSACFIDQRQQNFDQMINKINLKQSQSIFSKDKFHQMIRSNFQISLQTQNNAEYIKSQSAFLRPYLILLKQYLNSIEISFPHSKWKKMTKILQFIAVSKHQGLYKKMSLADCCLTPCFLGFSKTQLQSISKSNQQTILELINYYGKNKFISNLQNHFWLSESTRDYYMSLSQKMPNKISFFYACSKYPETAKIQSENFKAFYRIKGFQKKLMSDKYLQISQQGNSQYQLKLLYRSKFKVVVHFGIACFDEFKNTIHPLQVCRKADSMIRIKNIQGNKIYPTNQTKKNLHNWNFKRDQSDIFAYEKCIGIYSSGQIDRMPSLNLIITSSQSYSKQQGVYNNVTDEYIQLSKQGVQKLKQKVYSINQNTILMNHIQQGSYVLSQTRNSLQLEWREVNIKISGFKWDNTGFNFLPQTKYVRILAMLNYNSGHPDYFIENKQAQIDFKQIEWVKVK